MKPLLCLTTPVTRPWNLHAMETDAEMLRLPDLFVVRWLLIFDVFVMEQMGNPFAGYAPTLPWQEIRESNLPRPGPRFGEDNYNHIMASPPPEGLWPEEWHFGIADDSLPVAGEFKALRDAIDEGADVVVFPMSICQEHHCRADPTLLRPGVVSGGQVAFRRRVAEGLQWVSGNPCLDGIFVQRLWEATGSKDPRGDRDAGALGTSARWIFLDGPELAHNQLRRTR